MENDEETVKLLKSLRVWQGVSVTLMFFFTIISGVGFRLILDGYNAGNWFSVMLFCFCFIMTIRVVFMSFKSLKITSARRNILKTKGLVALQEHILREEKGKNDGQNQK